MSENWKIWDDNYEYGLNFYKRSIGEKDEMESSKASAKVINSIINDNDLVLDVGCGTGHYLVSIDKQVSRKFSYHGVDATKSYIELAEKAFSDSSSSFRDKPKFSVEDIFNISIKDNYADIVCCNNVLLHLPSIKKPMEELWRVTKKFLVIRTLIGTESVRVKFVEEEGGFDNSGEPNKFNYHNIYSQNYLNQIISKFENVKDVKYFLDEDFDKDMLGSQNFENDYSEHYKKFVTKVVNGMQVASYLIQPWSFLIIEKQ